MRESSELARRLDVSLMRLRVTVSSQACYRVAPTFVTGPPPWRVSVMRSLVVGELHAARRPDRGQPQRGRLRPRHRPLRLLSGRMITNDAPQPGTLLYTAFRRNMPAGVKEFT